MEFNERQLDAINVRNKNLLVSAGAGSGKTTVLVERIMSLLKENNDKDLSLDEIVVMTFSRKATTDLKKKIKNVLIENIENAKYNDIEFNKLTIALSLIQNANISTIDSFCKNLIEKHYTNLKDFDPSFRIADEKELNILYDDVLKNFLEEIYNDDAYKNFLNHYYTKNSSILSEIFNFGLNAINNEPYPIEKLNYYIDNRDGIDENLYSEYLESAKKYETYVDDLICLYKKAFESAKCIVEYFNENDKKNKITETEKSIRIWEELCINELSYFYDKINLSKDIIEKLKFSLKLVNEKNITYTNRISIKNDGMLEHIDILKEYKDTAVNFLKNEEINTFLINCEIKEDLFKNDDSIVYLKLLKEYYLRIEDEKRIKKILSIQDLSKLALKILYDDNKDENGMRRISDMGKKISEKYKHIFVDEYQDTNYLQEELIRAISNNYKNKNVFLVGDIKQSIYGFRGTKSELFVNKYKEYLDNKSDNQVINLNTNYRSDKIIIDFINSLFSFLMTEETLGLDYQKEGQLIKEKSEMDNKGEVVVDFIVKDSDIDNTVKEARNIIKRIKELLNAGYKYKDMVILMRTVSNKAEIYADEFMKAGIPLYVEMKRGFYQRFEIKLVIDILSIIDNPMQDIPLASVLTSKIFNITNEELAYIKIVYSDSVDFGKKESFILYDAVKYLYNIESEKLEKYKKYDVNHIGLKKKISKFFEKFNEAVFKSRFSKVSELIGYIFDEMQLYNIISTMKDGNIRRANLDILYKNAENFEKSSYVGLFNFLRYIERIKENELDEGIAKVISENDDIVRLMTIHASKGLEFPIVFLSNINYKKQGRNETFFYDDEYGFALDYYDNDRFKYKTYKQLLINKKNQLKNLKDELRLFYVALTRAKTKLYIQGIVDKNKKDLLDENILIYKNNNTNISKDKKITMDEFLNCKSFMDFMFLSIPHINNAYYKINLVLENEEDIEENDKNTYESIDIDKIENLVDGIMKLRARNNQKISKIYKSYTDENVITNLSYVYKNQYLTTKKPKLSVSEIKLGIKEKSIKETKIVDTSFYDDLNIDEEIKFDNDIKNYESGGVNLGNIYHRFMQFFDFSNVSNNEKYNIDISRDNIDRNKIEIFLKTSLCVDMKKAYKENRLYREKRFMKLFKESYLMSLKGETDEKRNNDLDPYIIVQGIIDCFYIEKNEDGKDEIVLVDYKTDKILSKNIDRERLISELKENYTIQLNLYKKALEEMTGMTVKKKIIYSFALNECIEV